MNLNTLFKLEIVFCFFNINLVIFPFYYKSLYYDVIKIRDICKIVFTDTLVRL